MSRVKHFVRSNHVFLVLVVAAVFFGGVIGTAGAVVKKLPEHTHVMLNGETIHGEMSQK